MLKKDSGLVVINVTRWDRKGANKKDPENCMIARAIKRELGLTECSVFQDAIIFETGLGFKTGTGIFYGLPFPISHFQEPNLSLSVPTPEICRQHMKYFDKGFGSGFSFTLRLPASVAELVGA